MDPKKTCHGLHYRYATEEDLLKGTPANPEDYPKKPKVKRAISPYATSNNEEENLPFVKRGWSNEELEKILTQAESSQAMAEAPGGYMTGRYVVTATLTVVNNGLTARETIMDYTKTINNEVDAMRKEFGLDD